MSSKEEVTSKLESFGISESYIRRAISVFEKNYGTDYNSEVITEMVFRLQEKDNNKNKNKSKQNNNKNNTVNTINTTKHVQQTQQTQQVQFRPYLTIYDACKLSVGDKIDHRDNVGRYVLATITAKKGSNLKLHYDGWSSKWDCYCDYIFELYKLAKPKQISHRNAHRFKDFKKGDFIDINPILRHPGWTPGKIKMRDKHSGQVQVAYEKDNKKFLYWAHLDNQNEVAEFTSRSGTNQSSQKHIENTLFKERKEKLESREKQFPLESDEKIQNDFNIGDILEVEDENSKHWVTGRVIDKENNWIVVHYEGFPDKFNQQIHVIKAKDVIRNLSSELLLYLPLDENDLGNLGIKNSINETDISYRFSGMLNILLNKNKNKWKLKYNENKIEILLNKWIQLFGTKDKIQKYTNETINILRIKYKLSNGNYKLNEFLGVFNYDIIGPMVKENLNPNIQTNKETTENNYSLTRIPTANDDYKVDRVSTISKSVDTDTEEFKVNDNFESLYDENYGLIDTLGNKVDNDETKTSDISLSKFLEKNSMSKYKSLLSDHGIESISDFKYITNKNELNRVINDLKLPFIIGRKFSANVTPYTGIHYEGL